MVKTVKREAFLRDRLEKINEAKRFPDAIVMDPGDDIICDLCNGEVLDEELTIKISGDGHSIFDEMLLCKECLNER